MDEIKFVGQLYYGSRWSSRYFGELAPFEYVGNLDSFKAYATRKGIWREILRLFGRRVSIAGLINDLIDIPLLGSRDKKTVLSEIIEIYEKHDADRTLMEWFSKELAKARKTNRHFTSISKHVASENALHSHSVTTLDEKFVIIDGAICRKDHLRHNGALYEAASHSSSQWILCDFPPIGMTKDNPEYTGELVFVDLDDGFEDVFTGLVPFCPDIGWFPYCRVAGFLNSKRLNREQFPTISMSLLFQRRPISPEPNADDLRSFVEGEVRNRIFLRELSARVVLYYLVPSMYAAWRISYERIDEELLSLVAQLFEEDRGRLDPGMVELYDRRLLAVRS